MNYDLDQFRTALQEEAALTCATLPTFTEKLASLYGNLRASTLSMIFHPGNWQVFIEVFKDPDVTRFVLNVMTRFLAQYSDARLQYDLLCKNLEVALCLDGPNPDMSLLPETITATMPMHLQRQASRGASRFVPWKPSTPKLIDVLLNNKVLVCVILIGLTSTSLNLNNPKP